MIINLRQVPQKRANKGLRTDRSAVRANDDDDDYDNDGDCNNVDVGGDDDDDDDDDHDVDVDDNDCNNVDDSCHQGRDEEVVKVPANVQFHVDVGASKNPDAITTTCVSFSAFRPLDLPPLIHFSFHHFLLLLVVVVILPVDVIETAFVVLVVLVSIATSGLGGIT